MKQSAFSIKKPLERAFSWLSAGILTSAIPLSITLPAKAQNYPDIAGHWAQSCIQKLTQQGIVSGYPDGTFKPDNVITRAEYAAMVEQAFPDVAPERTAIDFRDVTADYWAQEEIRTAYRKGFLSGYPDGEFRPEDLIVRVEAFVSLASGLDYPIPDAPEQLLRATYGDAAEIPEYADGQIAAATQQGILISPPKPQFEQRLMGASDPATRAQVSAALCKIKFDNSGVPPEYVVNPAQPGDGTPIALEQTCTNEAIGYTIRYPTDWQVNSGQVVPPCQRFDPEEITLIEQSESFDEAVSLRLADVSFDRTANASDPAARELSRRQTTVDGRQAVAIEKESTGLTILPEGVRFYQYLVDLGNEQTLIAATYDVEGAQYQRNKQVLDRMMDSLELNAREVTLG